MPYHFISYEADVFTINCCGYNTYGEVRVYIYTINIMISQENDGYQIKCMIYIYCTEYIQVICEMLCIWLVYTTVHRRI